MMKRELPSLFPYGIWNDGLRFSSFLSRLQVVAVVLGTTVLYYSVFHVSDRFYGTTIIRDSCWESDKTPAQSSVRWMQWLESEDAGHSIWLEQLPRVS